MSISRVAGRPSPDWASIGSPPLGGITFGTDVTRIPTAGRDHLRYRRYTCCCDPCENKAQCTTNRIEASMAWSMVTPRDEPLFMDLWTWSLREAARGSRVQRPAPHHSERVPPPLKPHAPTSPHLLSTMRAAAHTRHSGNAAHAERGPTCMCVRRAPSRARPCVAPPGSACSRRLCPAVRWSDRAHAAARGNPDESVAADASGASHGARRAHARERCGACWSSAQRAPEPAYARVT